MGLSDLTGLFFQNLTAWLFLLYDYLTSCKKLEKTQEPIMRSCVANGQTDGRTDGTEPNSMDTSASSGVQNRETFLSLLLRD